MPLQLKPRAAFLVFNFMVIFLMANAVWWFILMERVIDEKIDLSQELGASPEIIEKIYEQESSRRRMVMLEGVVFFLVLLAGLWMIYRTLVKQRELRQQQENFMMAITHELKTPLASINLYVDSLLTAEIAEQEKQNILPKIKHDVYRLKRQVENVLEVARHHGLTERSSYESFNLSQLLDQRLDALRKFYTNVNYRLKADIEESVRIYGDRRSIGKAIDLILENSLVHNEGRDIEIIVELSLNNNIISLNIGDNGCGVDKEELASIFDQFYRAGPELTRPSYGTGLGLYIAKEIINSHGGTISVISDGPSKGIKFLIIIKRGKEH
ncbi:MAG: HAMP domain-containing histidine kinase [candidate division Zixibacteria bacterium]|nr:HAMP domain-containing histidine kinase [candidate division Zixibacteria bacterium]